MEIKLRRIQKIAGVANIVCKVLFVLSIVGACLTLAGAVIYFTVGNFNLDLGGITLNGILSGTEWLSKEQNISEISAAFFECVSGAVLFGFIKAFLSNEISDGTPFTERCSKELLRLGILVCAVPLAEDMIVTIITSAMKAEIETTPGSNIIIGLILIIFSFVLSYGSEFLKSKNDNFSSNDITDI